MAVTNSSNKISNIDIFIAKLREDYPQFKFRKGAREHWSPKTQTISFTTEQPLRRLQCGMLHELAHALLGHTTYNSDLELLKMESQAWQLAAQLANKYDLKISDDHIQNCLDTYRDWLHRRSTCPSCGTHVLQQNSNSYKCFNCQTSWQVSSGRFVRPYRKTQN